jgi:hypothetical protein
LKIKGEPKMQVYVLSDNNSIVGIVSSARKALNFVIEGKNRTVTEFPLNMVELKNQLPDRRQARNKKK